MKSRWYQSLTFQLTILFSAASTVILLLLGLLILSSVEGHFESQDMEILTGKLTLVQRTVEKVRSLEELASLPERLDDSLIDLHGLSLTIVAPSGQSLYASSGADFPAALLDWHTPTGTGRPLVWETANNQPFRGISALVNTGVDGLPPAVVAVATDISMHEHFKASFQTTLWLFVLLAAVMTGVLGWVAARRSLRPLAAIKRKAADITAHQLHARLPVDTVPVELLDLVQTLNDMLARLESSFQKLSDFSSDIAHELRTPVSNLLTQTQVTLSKNRTADEYRDVLASNIEEFERLSRMISDMLFLAKSDNQLMVPHREQLNLQDEVSGLFEFYEALAEEKAIALRSYGSAIVSGDRLMLRRAINNLLSNAIRYTPAGGYIEVRLDDSDSAIASLSIENTGDTIPAEHLPRLFDRFYRVDASRQHFAEGAGLGLAITQSILRAHGGDISVRSNIKTTVFEITIPKVS